MLAHIESLVTGIYHQSVVQHIMLSQIIHESSHIIVHASCHLGIVSHIPLELIFRESLSCGRILVKVCCDGIIEGIILSSVGFAQAVYII